ncbi:transcriptional regulator [Thiocystis minor]|uniref:MucB/RseB C-terminal domain-containing protein n=1 Tax=Thiocystis minor TaxID=61597 RepID=UPI001912372A|nr:MucB/RseB C-terminal domain-containing protein [Thiocystis minor]MBK5963711.1 transcriptional regulator [Thiocystis minor]
MNFHASPRMSFRLFGFLCLCGLGAAGPALSAATAEEMPPADTTQQVGILLERMAEALRSLNYEGVLVYLHENRLETLSLLHHVEEGRVQERLISLSGPVRAVARERDRVLCALPDGHPLSVERHGGGHILATDGIDPALLKNHYHAGILGTARIAGRDTDVVGIIPRDRLRYGYRFHIDRETALPLKSDLIDQDQEPLEQLMFTSIVFKASDGVAPALVGQPVRNAPVTESMSRWRFSDPPKGFQLVMHNKIKQTDGSVAEHFLFTDRLSAYSIYVEDGAEEGLDGLTNIGAVHATGRKIDGHQVTVIGEVPAATVEAAIAGARLMP